MSGGVLPGPVGAVDLGVHGAVVVPKAEDPAISGSGLEEDAQIQMVYFVNMVGYCKERLSVKRSFSKHEDVP